MIVRVLIGAAIAGLLMWAGVPGNVIAGAAVGWIAMEVMDEMRR